MKIEELNFSVRTYNILKRALIDTVEQLQRLTDDELMHIRNLGRHSFEEIRGKLERHTLTNGDRIRVMTDEELAEWVVFQTGYRESAFSEMTYFNILTGNDDSRKDAEKAMLTWLKQPAKEVSE